MDFINELLFIPLRIFFDFPYLAFILAIILGYIFFKKKKIIFGITALLWLFFGIYEGLLVPLLICPPEDCINPIRIDLALVLPILLFCIIITVVESITNLRNVLPQMTSNPRSTKVLLIVTAAAFLAVGFIGGYYARDIHDIYNFIYNEKTPQVNVKRDQKTPPVEKERRISGEPISIPHPNSPDLIIHREPRFGLEITVPNGWKISRSLHNTLPYGYLSIYMPDPNDEGAFTDVITIWPDETQFSDTLDEYVKEYFNERMIYDSKTYTKINSYDAIVLKNFRDKLYLDPFSDLDVYFIKNENNDFFYRIEVETIYKDKKVNEQIAQALSTFTLLK